MINTLLSGILTVSMTVVNWILTPIYNLIDNANFGNVSMSTMLTNFNDFITTATSSLSWVVDATGIPRPVILMIFGVFAGCVGLKIQVAVAKLVLKVWDRIIA